MKKVNVLPPDVIAKIAAGEVVDRPASVIKELFENSLDAGATSIEIHLKDAGKELIHFKDNGHGISKEDLETIFQRHATSKLRSIDDLETLASMGFRGEALYSIAAVSDITIKTRDGALFSSSSEKQGSVPSFSGWEIHVRGGVRQALQPAPVSGHGTEIKIAELFFNTPARRNFLKNNTSEMAQIVNTVLPYALIYPQLRIQLTNAGKSILDFRPTTSQLDRIANAFNVHTKDLLQHTQQFDEHLSIRLTLGNINIQRQRRDMQYIFVNQRPVESKNISFNINDIFKLILPPGVYGLFVVELTINGQDVDVNIHPTKREVRLKGEAKINSLIRRMAEDLLMQHGAIKQVSSSSMQPSFSPSQQSLFDKSKQPLTIPSSLINESLLNTPELFEDTNTSSAFNSMDAHLFNQDSSLRTRFAQARYIGQLMNKFLLFEQANSLMMVDQHAAQERIMFEKFKNQIETGTIETQPLLTPILVKLTATERILYDEASSQLNELGIEATLFDEQTLAIQTQPLLLKNIEKAVLAILAGKDVAHCDKDTLARRACKASIVTGDKLDPAQVEHQRKQLLDCKDPFTCPHGRPTVIEITESFIDREFLRS